MTTIAVNFDNLKFVRNQPRELVEYILTKYEGAVDKKTLLTDLNDNKFVLDNSKANAKTTFQFYYRSLIKHNVLEVYEDGKIVDFNDPKVDVLVTRPKTSPSKISELENMIADLQDRLEALEA